MPTGTESQAPWEGRSDDPDIEFVRGLKQEPEETQRKLDEELERAIRRGDEDEEASGITPIL